MSRFKRCREFCDYETHYTNQAKNRYDSVIPYQRGANWFTSFAKRYAVPALKYLGKQAVNYGKDVFWDVVGGKDIKTAAKTQLKRGASGILDDISQKISRSTTDPLISSLSNQINERKSEGKQKGIYSLLSQKGRGKKKRKTNSNKKGGRKCCKRKKETKKQTNSNKKVKYSSKRLKTDIFKSL